MSEFDELKFLSEYEEFQCGICQRILNNPHFTPCCRQTYCLECISERLNTNNTCPYDCKQLKREDLRESELAFVNLLNKSKLRSGDCAQNCRQQVVSIETLSQHLKNYVSVHDLSATNSEIALLREEMNQLKSLVSVFTFKMTLHSTHN